MVDPGPGWRVDGPSADLALPPANGSFLFFFFFASDRCSAWRLGVGTVAVFGSGFLYDSMTDEDSVTGIVDLADGQTGLT